MVPLVHFGKSPFRFNPFWFIILPLISASIFPSPLTEMYVGTIQKKLVVWLPETEPHALTTILTITFPLSRYPSPYPATLNVVLKLPILSFGCFFPSLKSFALDSRSSLFSFSFSFWVLGINFRFRPTLTFPLSSVFTSRSSRSFIPNFRAFPMNKAAREDFPTFPSPMVMNFILVIPFAETTGLETFSPNWISLEDLPSLETHFTYLFDWEVSFSITVPFFFSSVLNSNTPVLFLATTDSSCIRK